MSANDRRLEVYVHNATHAAAKAQLAASEMYAMFIVEKSEIIAGLENALATMTALRDESRATVLSQASRIAALEQAIVREQELHAVPPPPKAL